MIYTALTTLFNPNPQNNVSGNFLKISIPGTTAGNIKPPINLRN